MSDPKLSPNVPGIWQSLALCALCLGITIGVEVVMVILRLSAGVNIHSNLGITIGQLIAWPVTIALGLRWAKVSFQEACPLGPFPGRIVPALLIAVLGVTILSVAVARLIPVPEMLQEMLKKATVGTNQWTKFVPIIVIAPLAEELFFRGLVLRGYRARYSTAVAVWASTILFGLIHLNPWQFIVAIPLGAGFAWLFLQTGSLWPCIIGHVMANFSANFLFIPLGQIFGYDAETQKAMGHFPPGTLAIGAVAALAGGLILWRQLRGARRSRVMSP